MITPSDVEAFAKLPFVAVIFVYNIKRMRQTFDEFQFNRHFGRLSVLHVFALSLGAIVQSFCVYFLIKFLVGEWP